MPTTGEPSSSSDTEHEGASEEPIVVYPTSGRVASTKRRSADAAIRDTLIGSVVAHAEAARQHALAQTSAPVLQQVRAFLSAAAVPELALALVHSPLGDIDTAAILADIRPACRHAVVQVQQCTTSLLDAVSAVATAVRASQAVSRTAEHQPVHPQLDQEIAAVEGQLFVLIMPAIDACSSPRVLSRLLCAIADAAGRHPDPLFRVAIVASMASTAVLGAELAQQHLVQDVLDVEAQSRVTIAAFTLPPAAQYLHAFLQQSFLASQLARSSVLFPSPALWRHLFHCFRSAVPSLRRVCIAVSDAAVAHVLLLHPSALLVPELWDDTAFHEMSCDAWPAATERRLDDVRVACPSFRLLCEASDSPRDLLTKPDALLACVGEQRVQLLSTIERTAAALTALGALATADVPIRVLERGLCQPEQLRQHVLDGTLRLALKPSAVPADSPVLATLASVLDPGEMHTLAAAMRDPLQATSVRSILAGMIQSPETVAMHELYLMRCEEREIAAFDVRDASLPQLRLDVIRTLAVPDSLFGRAAQRNQPILALVRRTMPPGNAELVDWFHRFLREVSEIDRTPALVNHRSDFLAAVSELLYTGVIRRVRGPTDRFKLVDLGDVDQADFLD